MVRVYNRIKLIDLLAEELAYRQNSADFWYYVYNDQEMSSYLLDTLVSFRDFAARIGLLEEVYQKALEIYDFSHSGRDDFEPDIDYIRHKHYDFEEFHKSSLIF